MRKLNTAVGIVIMTLISADSALGISVSDNLKWTITEESRQRVLASLDALFVQIHEETLDSQYVAAEKADLTISMLSSLKGLGRKTDPADSTAYDTQLINAYPISDPAHLLKMAFIEHRDSLSPEIRAVFSLVTELDGPSVSFTIPLQYLTRHWKTQTVGQTTYIYRDAIDQARALRFETKHAAIARKFGLEPETLTFYMCDNYQDILALLGFEFDRQSNGQFRDGYGVDAGHIFSIMNNEDFSHDIVHYYSGKINSRENRNGVTEEGIAYSWGNAYYTDSRGEMIEQSTLVRALDTYLGENPDASPPELFEANTKIFDYLAPELSVRSTISSLICDEVERVKGTEGIQTLINCGRKDPKTQYLEAIERLLGIDSGNFDGRVTELIPRYPKQLRFWAVGQPEDRVFGNIGVLDRVVEHPLQFLGHLFSPAGPAPARRRRASCA